MKVVVSHVYHANINAYEVGRGCRNTDRPSDEPGARDGLVVAVSQNFVYFLQVLPTSLPAKVIKAGLKNFARTKTITVKLYLHLCLYIYESFLFYELQLLGGGIILSS